MAAPYISEVDGLQRNLEVAERRYAELEAQVARLKGYGPVRFAIAGGAAAVRDLEARMIDAAYVCSRRRDAIELQAKLSGLLVTIGPLKDIRRGRP